MAAVSAALRAHATLTGTTADTVSLTTPVRRVVVENHSNAATIYCTLSTSPTSSAAADAGVVTAVAQADETFAIDNGEYQTIVELGEARYASLSVVGNGNDYSVEGWE